MHKTTGILAVVLFAIASRINAAGPPPPGYYVRGPPPSPLSSLRHGHGPPPGSPGGPPPPPSPYKVKPAGSSKIFGWLGSQMARIPNFLPRFPHHYPKHNGKPNYHPPNYQALILPSPHGNSISSGPETVKIMGPTYYTTSSLNEIYQPGQEYIIPGGGPPTYGSGSSSGSTTVYVTSGGGGPSTEGYKPGPGGYTISSLYQSAGRPQPPPQPSSGYQHQHQHQGPSDSSVYESASSLKYLSPSPPQQVKYQSLSQSYATAQPQIIRSQSLPPPPPPQVAQPKPQLLNGAYQQVGQSQISYQRVPAHKVFSPAPPQMFAHQQSGNVEVLPSKMISYNKETLSTGHPDYLKAVGGLVSSASEVHPVQHHYSGNAYPTQGQGHYSKPDPYSAAQPSNNGYHTQQPQRIDENLGSLIQNTSPQVAPLYDLSALDLASALGGGGGGASSGGQNYAASASNQQQNYAQDVPETVSLESLLSSFGGQQNQEQYQSGDSQGQYSHQYQVALPAPTNVQNNINADYELVPQSNSNQGEQQKQLEQQQEQDLSPSESSLSPGVQLINHGSQDGNPILEVIADANAPTYNGGHPFDINQLISMIEPGAQFEDIQAEGSENHGAYAEGDQAGAQSQIQEQVQVPEENQEQSQNNQAQVLTSSGGSDLNTLSQDQLKGLVGQTVKDASGQSYTVVQQGIENNNNNNTFIKANLTSFPSNSDNNKPPSPTGTGNNKKYIRKTWTIPGLKTNAKLNASLSDPSNLNNNLNFTANNVSILNNKTTTTTTNLLPLSTSSSSSSFVLQKRKPDFITNKFQRPVGGNRGPTLSPLQKDIAPPHDPSKSTDIPLTSADNFDVMTFGPENKTNVTRHFSSSETLSSNDVRKPLQPQLEKPFSSWNQNDSDKNNNKNTLQPFFTFDTTTVNPDPLSHTRVFSPKNPNESSLIYHTVRPFISSNRNLTYSYQNHPNHNYKVTPSTTNSSKFPLLGIIPGLVPTVNSFFDSVDGNERDGDSSSSIGHRDDLYISNEEGDLAASAARQVKAFAITVTPPPHLLTMKDKMVASKGTTQALETSTVSPDMISKLLNNKVDFNSRNAKISMKKKVFTVFSKPSKGTTEKYTTYSTTTTEAVPTSVYTTTTPTTTNKPSPSSYLFSELSEPSTTYRSSIGGGIRDKNSNHIYDKVMTKFSREKDRKNVNN